MGRPAGTGTDVTAPGPPGSDPEPDDPERVVAFSSRALGSRLGLHVRLPATGDAPGRAGSVGLDAPTLAWERVLAEFDQVDRALSRFRDDSELTALNRLAGTGRVVAVSWRLRTMLAIVHRASRLTDGRFDASVLTDLERIGERGAVLEVPDHARADTEAVVRLIPAGTPGARLVQAPAAPVDSGGIGKGLALRWAAAAAISSLPAGAGLLLDSGGDIVSAGAAPPDGWQVGIEDPVLPGPDAEPLAVLAVERGAVATSSVRVRNWVGPDGAPVHHLLDPRTGAPARTGLIAVTVAGLDPAWSEVWSKALFLAGRDGIGEEARARGMAAWWVDDAGRLGMTPEARQCSAWVAEGRVR
ncbi:MAG: FAD:protein FMN transferase [Chloroflexi bacterium]|nr:FAD:protein FMN transferase [Chloroflexota bacterium]